MPPYRTKTADAAKRIDACVRTVLRRLGGLPEVRGNRSVYVDCPFARAWWRERIIAQAADGDEQCARRVRKVVRIHQTYWEKLVDRIVFRNSTFGSTNIRNALLRTLAQFLTTNPDSHLSSYQSFQRLCRRTTAYQGRLELSILSDIELDELMASNCPERRRMIDPRQPSPVAARTHLSEMARARQAVDRGSLPPFAAVVWPTGLDRSLLSTLPLTVRIWNCLKRAKLIRGKAKITAGALLPNTQLRADIPCRLRARSRKVPGRPAHERPASRGAAHRLPPQPTRPISTHTRRPPKATLGPPNTRTPQPAWPRFSWRCTLIRPVPGIGAMPPRASGRYWPHRLTSLGRQRSPMRYGRSWCALPRRWG